ncbi:hypothetical protein NQ317_015696 [Molorchus minor]|uniref:Uncharacterized protein n=1 Tax=Molorchus minor TaxID=1323400 RepID=A0ABQ9JMR0_9CUCU|nr:hypothetical protein NQ317_015696 [Molorchus minor]
MTVLVGFGSSVMTAKGAIRSASPPPRRSISPDQPNPAEPITESPSTSMGRIGWALRTLLLCKYLSIIGNFTYKKKHLVLNVIIGKQFFPRYYRLQVNPATPRERRVQAHLELAELVEILARLLVMRKSDTQLAFCCSLGIGIERSSNRQSTLNVQPFTASLSFDDENLLVLDFYYETF